MKVFALGILVGLALAGCVLMILFMTQLPATSTASTPAPARLSGQAIALTCARMANVDMAGLITQAQAQEMERCAERMMALMR